MHNTMGNVETLLKSIKCMSTDEIEALSKGIINIKRGRRAKIITEYKSRIYNLLDEARQHGLQIEFIDEEQQITINYPCAINME